MIKIHHAEYVAAEIEDYRDQPLINALPLLNSPQNTAKELNRYPQVRDSEKTLPGYIRRHAMMRILDGFLYPTKAHLQLEQMISGMIRCHSAPFRSRITLISPYRVWAARG